MGEVIEGFGGLGLWVVGGWGGWDLFDFVGFGGDGRCARGGGVDLGDGGVEWFY